MIDKSGHYWKGESHEDLREYLTLLASDGEEKITDVVRSVCACGGTTFSLRRVRADAAERKCTRCKKKHLIADSERRWETARPTPVKCTCGAKEFDVVVGYAIPSSLGGNMLWVGTRCVACGQLGTGGQWRTDAAEEQLLGGA